jgi:cysteine desulfurase
VSPVTSSASGAFSEKLGKNFQEHLPFCVKDLENLDLAFSLGDSDPRWSIGPGAENALRLQRALEVVARVWGLPVANLTVVPDRYLAFYLAIMGVIRGSTPNSSTKITKVCHSPIEKKEILAIVEGLTAPVESMQYGVGLDGIFDFAGFTDALCIVQLRNGETGISQRELPSDELVIDATSSLPGDLDLFDLQTKPWRTIILDASSWGGPRGVYYLAINPAFPWQNPFPTLDTAMPTFGANFGLTLMASLALEEFLAADQGAISSANEAIRDIVSSLPEVDIAGRDTRDRLSLSFLYVQSEILQRRLWDEGFLVDSGSACSSSALEPSHVLTRMGLLSHGNVRLRLRPENLQSADQLARSLVRVVQELRN